MSGPNKNNNPAEDLMAALLKELGEVQSSDSDSDSEEKQDINPSEPLELLDLGNGDEKTVIESNRNFSSASPDSDFDSKTSFGYANTQVQQQTKIASKHTQLTHFENLLNDMAPSQLPKQKERETTYDISDDAFNESASDVFDKTKLLPLAFEVIAGVKPLVEDALPTAAKPNHLNPKSNPMDSLFGPSSEELPITYLNHEETVARVAAQKSGLPSAPEVSNETVALPNTHAVFKTNAFEVNDRTVALHKEVSVARSTSSHESERTLAVTGFKLREDENHEDKIKVAIGHNRPANSSGYSAWGGGSDVSLGHSENLRIAQEKILDLEKENEKLRIQNEELLSASEIIKERSDLLTAQVSEYKNDRDGLEESFKNEIALLKGHLHRKDVENQKAQIKIDDLDSRLKFDMKKIRIRERELENRLELVRAEKNALMKSKDEQILDLRRKMDVLQMEVDSYRQKCIDLNKSLEVNQDSFKRTTRALRLAMANLELQEENKISLKKVD